MSVKFEITDKDLDEIQDAINQLQRVFNRVINKQKIDDDIGRIKNEDPEFVAGIAR